ncbi:helix-turn-helix domain-containing protein [Streptomyces sp. ME02-6978a]|uniref:helix-turn-helix domain-containing protein n=1 Tax=unclassified Streptomyces TaxID=2593676 RepID=UPI0029B519CF|nr:MULTISPECIES: helix-turn-helix domain-containing protein [unclassified Streptomyces]MDX3087154.1 helix-turn-helix domain-containing protein [Streptomyces sp. ME12-02E]MDX3335797.1 helix-turn-helix domain-containing protein [Streptomyces sp. ME02-6978a]
MTTAAPLTPAQVAALPAMPSALEAFAALNIGETLGYQLIREGQFPIEVIRFGRAFRVRKAELLAYLGLTEFVAAEVQSAAATDDDAPGVQPGAPSTEQPAPTSK